MDMTKTNLLYIFYLLFIFYVLYILYLLFIFYLLLILGFMSWMVTLLGWCT